MVSVIISAYNAKHFILETINSVLGQTYDNLELILVDDGSTDSTINEIDSNIQDQRLSILKNQHTGNIGKNLNDGIKVSSGEYICVLGADDVWLKNKLEIQMQFIQKYSFICSNAFVIDEMGVTVKERYFDPINGNFEYGLADLLMYNKVIASSVLINSQVFKECGYFDEVVGNRAEDYFLWLNIASRYPAYFIEQPLLKYRKHKNNLSFKTFEDTEALTLRAIQLKEKYLQRDAAISEAAELGISLSYSQLMKECIRVEKYEKAIYYSRKAKQYMPGKQVLKYIKYSLLAGYILFLKIFKKRKLQN